MGKILRAIDPDGMIRVSFLDSKDIVNTAQSAEEIRLLLHGYKGAVYTVDARAISTEALGKNFPNSPMLAAAVAVSGIMSRETFMKEMKASYSHKFAKKPEVIEGNMKALEMTFDALKDNNHFTVIIADKDHREDVIYYNPEFGVCDDIQQGVSRLIDLLEK